MKKFQARIADGSTVDAEWGYGLSPEDVPELSKQLLPRMGHLWAIDDRRGIVHRLGSGFVVSSGSDTNGRRVAFLVTSYHVIEGALQVLNESAFLHSFGEFARPFAKLLEPYLKRKALHFIVHGATPDSANTISSCLIRSYSVNPRADLCFLSAFCPSNWSEVPTLAIDSDPLDPDHHTLLLAGFAKTPGETPAVLEANRTWQMPGIGFEARIARIKSVDERLPLRPIFGYQASAPIPPGLSGGPVFALRDGFTPLNVVGVCMADSNEVASENDITAAGNSYIVGSQNFYSVLDPVGARIKAWQEAPDATRGRPPIGGVFKDFGLRTGELAISLDSQTNNFVVTRVTEVPKERPLPLESGLSKAPD